MIDILNHKIGLGKQNIKVLEDKYIEKYGNEDFQLRKYYLHRFWKNSNKVLSKFSLEGDCPDEIPIDSTITIKDLPFDSIDNISLDLPQILGRRKLDSNSWKNSVIFYYREEFDKIIKNKIELTNHVLSLFDKGTEKERAVYVSDQEDLIKINNYKKNYVSVNKHDGNSSKLVFNKLVLVSEKRAFDIQSVDYKDRFSVFNRIDQAFDTVNPQTNEEVSKFFEKYDEIKYIQDKLRFICETKLSEPARVRIENSVDNLVKNYLALGKNRLKACGYKVEKLKNELDSRTFDLTELSNRIYNTFKIGEKYTKDFIKITLKEIYDEVSYKKTAKAVDLENYFEIKTSQFMLNGKKVKGFEILKKK